MSSSHIIAVAQEDLESYVAFNHGFEIGYPESFEFIDNMAAPLPSVEFSDPNTNHTTFFNMTIFPPETDYNDLIDEELHGVGNETKVNEILQYPTLVYFSDSETHGDSYSYTTGPVSLESLVKNIVFSDINHVYKFSFQGLNDSFDNDLYQQIEDSIDFFELQSENR